MGDHEIVERAMEPAMNDLASRHLAEQKASQASDFN